jgi:hypothetical protein
MKKREKRRERLTCKHITRIKSLMEDRALGNGD